MITNDARSINTANSTLSSSFYLSKYYAPNRSAGKSSSRKDIADNLLLSYDSRALNKFIKDVRRIDEHDVQTNADTNLKNKVSAFVSIYNNFTKSVKKSTSSDVLKRSDKLIKLTKNEKSALEKIGITIKDDSSLKLDADKLEHADIDKVKSLFSSSSDFMKQFKKTASRLDIRI